jgi:hypothetical protein
VTATEPDRLDPDAALRFGRFALEPDDILCVRTGSTGPLALVEDGRSVPEAIRSGCGAFATAVLLVSTLIGVRYGIQNRDG